MARGFALFGVCRSFMYAERLARAKAQADALDRRGARIANVRGLVFFAALALIIVGTFAGHAVAGPNGILAWGGYHRALQERQAELALLEAQRSQMRHRSALLDPRKADPDIADELVRKDLGLVRPDEVIIPLD